MRKKIMAVVLSCLTIFALVASSFAVTFSASAVSVDEMTKALYRSSLGARVPMVRSIPTITVQSASVCYSGMQTVPSS